MRTLLSILTNSLLLFGLTTCSEFQREHVDLIVHNARIYTVDESFSVVEAMAISNDTIIAIGAEHEILNRYQAQTMFNARKQYVYPGFIDGHCHFVGYAQNLQRLDLTGTASWQECLERLQAFAASHNYPWLVGRGWDQNDWANSSFPTKTSLDSLFPDTPVVLYRIDGHAVLANSAALREAQLTSASRIEGGEIVLSDGEPTGLLIDRATKPVIDRIPDPSDEVIRQLLTGAQDSCFRYGITSLADAGLTTTDIEHIQRLHADSSLKLRIYAMLSDDSINYATYLDQGPWKTPSLHVASFKIYADGALGSRGAALLKPYSDAPENSGLILRDPAYFMERAQQLYNAGFQVNTHCIGDSAVRLILDVYGSVLNGVNDRRWRIEHAQVVHPDDLNKFQAYTILPSMQPTHATSDMYWAEDRLGDRIATAYALKELLKQNGLIALGTDFPVEKIDPLQTFYAAVFRQDRSGFPEGGFQSENALSREEALRGMTIWNAMAQFEEDEKGSLEVGKWGDFVVLNQDILTVPQEEFGNMEVVATFLGGNQVYSR